MIDWFKNYALKFAMKEIIAVGFIVSCFLAKLFPLFDEGDFRADAVLYMLFFGLIYFVWDHAR